LVVGLDQSVRVEWNHNHGLVCSSAVDVGEFKSSSNMTSLTSPSGEILEILQYLVNAVRNLLGCVYWGYNLTQYAVIKEVGGGNGQQSKAFFVFEKKPEKNTHLVPLTDMVQFSCKFQSRFELIIRVSPIYSHNTANHHHPIQAR